MIIKQLPAILACAALIGCGSGEAQLTIALTSGQALMTSAEEASVAADALLLHVVRTEAHIALADDEDDAGALRGASPSARPAGGSDAGEDGDVDSLRSGWRVVSDRARNVDLRQLAGQPEEIAEGSLPAGRLTQIRLILAPDRQGTLVRGDEERAVTVPSGAQTGLKLVMAPPIRLVAGSTTAVTLELGGTLERDTSSGYFLRPVVRLRAR